jgi:hypothetical protein
MSAKPVDPKTRTVLAAKNSDLGPLVRQAARDDELLDHLLAGLTEKNETWRYNCFKAVYRLAQENPARVYPCWDQVAASLASDNGYHRAGAALLLPLLLPADKARRFDRIRRRYFALLDDESIVVARYVAQSAAAIAGHRPDLTPAIARVLLEVEGTHHRASRKELLKSDVIEALERLYPALSPAAQKKTMAFAQALAASSSPRTRKAAGRFQSALDRTRREPPHQVLLGKHRNENCRYQ